MTDNKLNRKAFLKTFGLGIGAMAVGIPSAIANYSNDKDLTSEKQVFLKEYEEWLSEFQNFVNKRNDDSLDINNNKRLMELSKQAEERKPQMEKFMEDPKFAKYFNEISANITNSIKQ